MCEECKNCYFMAIMIDLWMGWVLARSSSSLGSKIHVAALRTGMIRAPQVFTGTVRSMTEALRTCSRSPTNYHWGWKSIWSARDSFEPRVSNLVVLEFWAGRNNYFHFLYIDKRCLGICIVSIDFYIICVGMLNRGRVYIFEMSVLHHKKELKFHVKMEPWLYFLQEYEFSRRRYSFDDRGWWKRALFKKVLHCPSWDFITRRQGELVSISYVLLNTGRIPRAFAELWKRWLRERAQLQAVSTNAAMQHWSSQK